MARERKSLPDWQNPAFLRLIGEGEWPRRVPRDAFEEQVYRAYLQAAVARWERHEAEVLAPSGDLPMPAPGVWRLLVRPRRPADAATTDADGWPILDLDGPLVQGVIWLVEIPREESPVAAMWQVGEHTGREYEQPALDWGDPPPFDAMLSVREAAHRLGVGESAVRYAIKRRSLVPVRLDGRTHVLRSSEVERYARERRKAAPPRPATEAH